jgi:hypothetical protein
VLLRAEMVTLAAEMGRKVEYEALFIRVSLYESTQIAEMTRLTELEVFKNNEYVLEESLHGGRLRCLPSHGRLWHPSNTHTLSLPSLELPIHALSSLPIWRRSFNFPPHIHQFVSGISGTHVNHILRSGPAAPSLLPSARASSSLLTLPKLS